MISAQTIIARAVEVRTVVPAFNIPYLPMMEPVVRALRDCDSCGFVDVARLEWIKFAAGGPEPIKREYDRVGDPRYTRLHLDHVPVIDEDNQRVDFLPVFQQCLDLGYDSVMVDGSRLSLDDNIAATKAVCELAHRFGIAVEGELGAVMGHEVGPLPSYEELFAGGKGFTDADEAARFVEETGVDWLSIAFGNVHGAIAAGERSKEKIRARLNIDHLRAIRRRVAIPIVLHGGSGIALDNVLAAIQEGVAKINIATDLRRPYERLKDQDHAAAVQAVYDATVESIERLQLRGNARRLGTKE